MEKFFEEILKIIIPMSITIGLLLYAIKIAKKMSGEAGAMAISAAKKIGMAATGPGAFVGKHTIGRAASVIAGSKTTKKILSGFSGGRYVSQGLQAAASYGFGGKRGGYAGAVKQTKERQEEFAKYLGRGEGGGERQAAYAARLRGGGFKQGVARYTGIGAAAQQAAKPVKEMYVKTAAKEKRAKELIKKKEELAKLQKENIPLVTDKEIGRLKEIEEKIKKSESGKMGASLTRGEADKLREEANQIRIKQEHHKKHNDRIAELQKEIDDANKREEQSKEMETFEQMMKKFKQQQEQQKEQQKENKGKEDE